MVTLAFGQVLEEAEILTWAKEQKGSLLDAGYDLLQLIDGKTLLLLKETQHTIEDITVLEPQRMSESFGLLLSDYIHRLSTCGLHHDHFNKFSPRWLLVRAAC